VLLLGLLCSAPAGVRHIGISAFFPSCLKLFQQFYQFIATDKTGVKLKEYSIGLRCAFSFRLSKKVRGSGLGLSVYVSCRWCDCGMAQIVYETA